METLLVIYFASVVGKIVGMLEVVGGIILFISSMYVVWNLIDRGAYARKYEPENFVQAGLNLKSKGWKRWVWGGVIFLVFSSLLPSEKQVYIMAAGFMGQKLVQSEVSGKVVTIINQKLDSYIEEAEKTLKK